jgi:hypothetical protein
MERTSSLAQDIICWVFRDTVIALARARHLPQKHCSEEALLHHRGEACRHSHFKGAEQQQELPGKERKADCDQPRPRDARLRSEECRRARDQKAQRGQFDGREGFQSQLGRHKGESPDYRGQRGENGIAKPHFRDPGSSQPVGYPASCRNSGIARSKPRVKRSTTSSISLRVTQSGGENELISP